MLVRLVRRIVSLTHCCTGVSLLTQLLYVAVFLTRYLDLFWVSPGNSTWNFLLKNFYIWSSIYIIVLMTRVYARTREREKAWRLGGYSFGGSLIAAPIVTVVFRGWMATSPSEMLWVFSIILESVCVLPQLLLLRQTTVPTVIDSFYLVTLGSYRGFYILNWIVRAVTEEHYFDPIAVIFGVVQTAFYLDFAWVYWTRQRVKLRGGGIVDSEDLRKGWLVTKIIPGRASVDGDEEAPSTASDAPDPHATARTPRPNRWGARGVSVSADDTLDEHQQHRKEPAREGMGKSGSGQESVAMLESEDDLFSDGDVEDDAKAITHPELNADQEWRADVAGRSNSK